MPLDPRLSLAARPVDIPTSDPLQRYATLAALNQSQRRAQLQELQIAQALRAQQQDERLAAYLAGGGEQAPGVPLSALRDPMSPQGQLDSLPQDGRSLIAGPAPGPTIVRAPDATRYAALPGQGQPPAPRQDGGLPRWQDVVRIGGMRGLGVLDTIRKSQEGDATQQKALLEQSLKGYEVLEKALGAIRDAPTLATVRQQVGALSPQLAQLLPETYSAEGMAQARQTLLPLKDRLEMQVKQQELTRAGQKVDYGYGPEMNAAIDARYGDVLRQTPGARPIASMVAQARQDVQEGKVAISAAQGEQAARLTTTSKPLEGEAATAVAEYDALLALQADVQTLYTPDFVGPVRGRTGGVREVTGPISTEEIQLRRAVNDMKDTLLRARSGAAITPAEYTRLSGLVPNVTDQPNVFEAKMQAFARATEQARAARLNVATTGRGPLQAQQGTPRPLGQPAASGGQSPGQEGAPTVPAGAVTPALIQQMVAIERQRAAQEGRTPRDEATIRRDLQAAGYRVR